ncbi:MAG TPA: hypothetical protein VGM76_07545 [Lacipirellulaceae bacterium]|jgi:DNA-directed RNA polymerase subunit RPC12/RpoP
MTLQECPYCTGKSFVRGAISTGGAVTFVPAPDPEMSMVAVGPTVSALACSTCGAIFLGCNPNELPSG